MTKKNFFFKATILKNPYFYNQVKEPTDRILCNAADLKIHDLKVLIGANSENVAGKSSNECMYSFVRLKLHSDTDIRPPVNESDLGPIL